MLLAVVIDFLGNSGRRKKAQLRGLSDQELIKRYQEKAEMEILSVLMDRYEEVIIARTIHFLGDEAETRDFIGELYLKLADRLKRVGEIQNFKAWIRRVITNALIDIHQKNQRRQQYITSDLTEDRETELKIALGIDTEAFARLLDQLKPIPRLYIIEHFFRGKPNREIAQQHKLDMNQVRGARTRALKKLKSLLGAEFAQYFSNE